MKKYAWILFDADETLFHFDSFAGLQHMFAQHNINFTDNDFQDYQRINKALWKKYQQHEINPQQIQHQRFQYWADRLNICPGVLNEHFMQSMAEIARPIEGVSSLLTELHGHSKLGIITNGFSALQEVRLQRTGFRHYFNIVVVSEEVGIAKPHPDIFTHALAAMGHPEPKDVLMVGDNLQSDIIGGNQAGFDTCWFNPNKQPAHKTIQATYQVQSHAQLEKLLCSTQGSSVSQRA